MFKGKKLIVLGSDVICSGNRFIKVVCQYF